MVLSGLLLCDVELLKSANYIMLWLGYINRDRVARDLIVRWLDPDNVKWEIYFVADDDSDKTLSPSTLSSYS